MAICKRIVALLILCHVVIGIYGEDPLTSEDVVVYIRNQKYKSSVAKAEQIKANLLGQALKLGKGALDVVMAHDDFISYGAWTIFPLIPILQDKFGKKKWYYFCEDTTEIDLAKLLSVLSSYKSEEKKFLGHALRDSEPAIIHHFAFFSDPSQFAFPDFDAGWALSASLMVDLARRLKTGVDMNFSIDVKHEIAMFIYNDNKGINMTDVAEFCINKKLKENCASTVNFAEPECGKVPGEEMLVAVKTCEKYHQDRVPVIKKTVEKFAKHLRYYSDVVDNAIPTEYIGVENTERGHCQKLFNIINKFSTDKEWKDMKWLVVIDDDTVMNFQRLQRLLACYDPTEPIFMGERYGYGVNTVPRAHGYEYITGGGGMILSREGAAKVITGGCTCPSIDTPDDMWLGMCFRRFDIPTVHINSLHQAKPNEYVEEFLQHRYLVSFHKHLNVDPMKDVYERFLDSGHEDVTWGRSKAQKRSKTEL